MPAKPVFEALETAPAPAYVEVHLEPLRLRCSARTAFGLFRNAQNYPLFMQGLDAVELLDPTLIRCSGHLHENSANEEEWKVRVVSDERYLVIGWQLLDVGVEVSGAVRFDDIEPSPSDSRRIESGKSLESRPTQQCLLNCHFSIKGVQRNHKSIGYIRKTLMENGRAFRQKAQGGGLASFPVQQAEFETNIQARFQELADRWEQETAHLFSAQERLSHPACRQIAAMGEEAVPLIVRDLSSRKGEWLMLLAEMTGQEIGIDKTVIEAEEEWIQWAKTFSSAPK